jgi:hypothetical protein
VTVVAIRAGQHGVTERRELALDLSPIATAASGCLLDRDFHSFAGKHRVGEPFLTQFFDALKKLVVMVRVVMRESQALYAGHFRKLHGLIEAAVSPSTPFLQFLGRVLRVMDQQVRAARQFHQLRIDLLAMLDIDANDEHFPISLDPETVRSAGMVMPLSRDYGFHIVDAGEMFGGISDLQEFEVGPHVIQLHREIFRLHLDFENLPQIADCLVTAERQQRDFLFGIISRGKERKALDVVPVKVRERDTDLLLLVADGAKVSAQISQSRAGVNDGDLVRIGDLQAGGVAAELLKTGIADGDGSPRTIKLELHRIVFMKLGSWRASIKMQTSWTYLDNRKPKDDDVTEFVRKRTHARVRLGCAPGS